MTHKVNRGESIQVEYVDFKSGESLDELTERIHEVEHLIIVKSTRLAIVRLWEERLIGHNFKSLGSTTDINIRIYEHLSYLVVSQSCTTN